MPKGTVPQVGRRPRSSIGTHLRLLRRPASIWKHLRILADHGYAEDCILLYEITNQGTSSNRWRIPTDQTDYTTFENISELYSKTKRYAQATTMLKAMIQTFPDQRPFSYPNTSSYIPEDDRIEETEATISRKDSTWYSYYFVLHKTNKYRDAYDALQNIRGPAFKARKDEALASLIRQMKNPIEQEHVVPEPWKAELPDETSARICSSSLGPVMSLLKKNKADPTLVKRFSEQFIGTERNDVYWWLKSTEAVGQHKIYEAITCLKKMSHQNPRVLVEMARLSYKIDRRDEARRLLKTAHYIDSMWIDGMDLLAFLCLADISQNFQEHALLIEGLAHTLTKEWPHRVETSTVNGFLAHHLDVDTACAFANRAMKQAVAGTDQFVFAVHLQVYVLRTMELKAGNQETDRYRTQAQRLLEEAVEAMPNSTDLGLLYVDTLLESEEGHRDAKIFATKFLHDNQDNVHAKLLKVHVLVNGVSRNPDANHTKELFTLLEEVIAEHPHILAAYCFLLSEYARLKNSEKCKEILDKLTAARPFISHAKTHKFHRMKADYLLKTRDVIPAYEHLMAAIATGATFDHGMMANFETELLSTKAVTADYENLAFLDPILPERPTSSTQRAVTPALQEVVNDHENEQDSFDEGDEEEETES